MVAAGSLHVADVKGTYDGRDERTIGDPPEGRPDATLTGVAPAIGTPAHTGTVSWSVVRRNLPREKLAHVAEKDRAGENATRPMWLAHFPGTAVKRLTSAVMRSTHGPARQGVRVVSKGPQALRRTTSMIAAMAINGIAGRVLVLGKP